MNWVLERHESSDQGTFGRWLSPTGVFFAFSGELPQRDNVPGKSCIPVGVYDCDWVLSTRLRRYTYRLRNVPGRAGILLHSCNFMGDAALGYKCQLLGCIALSERMGVMDKQKALLISRPAVRRFEERMKGRTFKLEVRDYAVDH